MTNWIHRYGLAGALGVSLALNCVLAFQAWQYRGMAQSLAPSKEKDRGEYLGDDAEIRALATGKAIVLFGDSIVQRWGHPMPLAVNRGIATETSDELVRRVAPDVIVLKPHAMVLLGGINDFTHDPTEVNCAKISTGVITNLQTVAEAAKAAGIAVSISSLLPTGTEGMPLPGNCWAQIPLVNRALQTWTAQHGMGFLDFYSVLTDGKGHYQAVFTDDGLHPNAAGYAVMVKVLSPA